MINTDYCTTYTFEAEKLILKNAFKSNSLIEVELGRANELERIRETLELAAHTSSRLSDLLNKNIENLNIYTHK